MAFSYSSAAVPAALLLMARLLPPACGRHESNVEAGARTRILHVGNADEPQDLDPHIVAGIPETEILMALFEGLVGKDPADLGPRPGVAESWDVSADHRTWTFHLPANARWSNGEPLTAMDFVWSWQRALSPRLGNPYAYMFYVIRNARAFHTGTLADFAQVAVHAPTGRRSRWNWSNRCPISCNCSIITASIR